MIELEQKVEIIQSSDKEHKDSEITKGWGKKKQAKPSLNIDQNGITWAQSNQENL